ncbi:MAG TPA: hypothetical protein VGB26_07345 [Nitrospiria bacterium]|jgi:hypothetical protein
MIKDDPIDLVNDNPKLVVECRVITHYLVFDVPSSEIIQRYIHGHSFLLEGSHSEKDLALTDFVCRFSWSISYLDAWCGLFQPNSLLRKKILLMISILEASPCYTSFFIGEAVSLPGFFYGMARYSLQAAIKVVLGVFLYPIAVRGR